MQLLERVHLVQFFLFEAQTLELSPTTAVIAPNGAGKSALLDALQIVLLGGDRRAIRFNAQAGGSARARSIRDYCLGTYRSGEDGRKRRTATTYVSLVFRDRDSGLPLTAGIALGATKWEVSWDIVLPYTRSAVIGGVFLGLGRALGETMAVAFVIGNSVGFTKSLLEPSTTIAALIANDFGEATEEYRAALLLLGFVLFIVTFVVLALARLMLMNLSRKEGNR